MNKSNVGLIGGLGAASIWGGMYVVNKVMVDMIPPFTLSSLRLLHGAIGKITTVSLPVFYFETSFHWN